MCWNAEVSLNTFMFSSFVLLLIIYNNTYTKYKIKELNLYWYIFFMSVILMQLVEYFIWRNINNPFYNYVFSLCTVVLLTFQPLASLMLLQNAKIKQVLIMIYLLFAVPYLLFTVLWVNVYSAISPTGHLQWYFTKGKYYEYIGIWLFYLFFLLFAFFYNGYTHEYIMGIVFLMLAIYNYYKDNSVGSMWCWIVNSVMIYYAVYLLIYLPYILK